jgi:hypothetical protein
LDDMPDYCRTAERTGALLMRTWDDGEAVIVRQLLAAHGIPCQVVSDVPHAVLPIRIDGLGEVRILVAMVRLAEARTVLAEHRRVGFRALRGGRRDLAPRERLVGSGS